MKDTRPYVEQDDVLSDRFVGDVCATIENRCGTVLLLRQRRARSRTAGPIPGTALAHALNQEHS